MIIDKIENANLYQGIHQGIDMALNYLKNTDFSHLEIGKHDLEDGTNFVILKELETTGAAGKLLESHLKYIDVQYVIEGIEQMGVTLRTDQEPKKHYDADDDYMLFDESYDVITVKAGMFVVFFPDDIHMPEITTGTPSTVKKAVVKVKI